MRTPSLLTTAVIVVPLIVAGGCGGPRPVLYPNDHLEGVGMDEAREDVADCIEQAKDYGLDPYTGATAEDTAGRAASGAATDAATTAVGGGDPATAAVRRATHAGVSGLMNSIFGKKKLDPDFKRFVNECLQEKGYETGGWK